MAKSDEIINSPACVKCNQTKHTIQSQTTKLISIRRGSDFQGKSAVAFTWK